MAYYKRTKQRKRKLNNLRKQVRVHWAHLAIKAIGDIKPIKVDSITEMLSTLENRKFGEKEFEWVLHEFNSPEPKYKGGIDPYDIEHTVTLGADPRDKGELIFHGEGLRAQIEKSNKL